MRTQREHGRANIEGLTAVLDQADMVEACIVADRDNRADIGSVLARRDPGLLDLYLCNVGRYTTEVKGRGGAYEGVRDAFWLQGMMAGFPASYFCIKAFSETDLTEDLKKIDVPTLVMHGDDDQIVPIADSALLSSKITEE
jgi:pimeloyl-ACP methyl ester carboxylesterase